MKIYGICGYSGAGKDTVANLIKEFNESIDCNIRILSLAQKLKYFLALLEAPGYGINMHGCTCIELLSAYYPLIEQPKLKEELFLDSGLTRRKFLQDFGLYIRQNFGEDYFCKSVEAEITKIKTSDATSNFFSDDMVIIPDIRFINELAFFKKFENFRIIYVDRPDLDLTQEKYKHASELDIGLIEDTCDIFINNEGTMTDLRNEVIDKVIVPIIKRQQ